MGDLGILIIGVVDTFFAFFVVAPMMLQAASLFGVQKRASSSRRTWTASIPRSRSPAW